MIRPEHRAILGVLGLAVLGQGVRVAVMDVGTPPGAIGTAPVPTGARSGSPTAHRDSAADQLRPLADAETVDFDQEPASKVARVPGIGPRLAREIIADRERHGPFGGLSGLDRVPGIGPGKLNRIAPHARFSGSRGGAMSPGVQEFASPLAPQAGPRARIIAPARQKALPDLNSADSAALVGLPGVGPRRAQAIVEWRGLHGPFATVHDLARVPHLGERVASKIWQEVHRSDP